MRSSFSGRLFAWGGVMLLIFSLPSGAARAGFLGLFESGPDVTKVVYELNEQTVALIKAPDGVQNQHPVTVDKKALMNALSEIRFWEGGGVFSNQEQERLFPGTMAESLGNYMADALALASPGEDVYFVVRGYGRVAFGMGKERFWNSGRAFYDGNQLNIIIGEHAKQEKKDQRLVEGAFGITESDEQTKVYVFSAGSRDAASDVKGEIVVADGVSLKNIGGESRENWIVVDIDTASEAYAQSLISPEDRARDVRLEQEAARRTLETREMKAELARLRAQMSQMGQGGAGASVESVEERLKTLATLKEKGLITEDEYATRRKEILEGI